MDLSKELLTPVIDVLAFPEQPASDTYQFRRDIIMPRLPGRMRQLAKNIPNGSELLFGDDLNKSITQISNTSNALLTKNQATLYHTNLQQIKWVGIAMVKLQPINIKTVINVQKTCIPPEKLSYWEKGEQAEQQKITGTEKIKYVKFQCREFKKSLL